jgi:hypothetical protein
LVEYPEERRPFPKPRSRLEDNKKMDLNTIAWEVFDWIRLTLDRDHWWALVITAMNIRVP